MPNRDRSVLAPNLGIFLDRPPLAVPARGLKDCLNVRIKDGEIQRRAMGWGPFPDAANAINVTDPVTGMKTFIDSQGIENLIICTTKDIYLYRENQKDVVFLTPREETGTVSTTATSTTVTGSGTSWTTTAKTGDFIHVGATGQVDPTAAWFEIATVDSDTQLTLASAFPTTESGAAYTLRQTFTGNMDEPWLFETFINAEALTVGANGDRIYMTNGVDPVKAWFIGESQVYEPNLGLDSVGSMRRYKSIMVYGNIVESGTRKPTSIRTSAISEPENVSTKEAAEFIVHDGVDPLLNSLVLGDNLVLYGSQTIVLTQFIGGDLLFVFRTVIQGNGPVAARAIVDFGDFHEFIGQDTKYRFDGVQIIEREPQAFREVTRILSPERSSLTLHIFDEEEGEVLWVSPLTTDEIANGDTAAETPPERAYVDHYLEQVERGAHRPVTIRELPALSTAKFQRETSLTWDQVVGTWEEQDFRWDDRFTAAAFPLKLFGTKAGDVFILNELDTQNGTGFRSHATTRRMRLGNIRRKGVIQRIYPFAEQISTATYDLQIRVHTTRDPGGATTSAGTFQYDLQQAETSNHFVSPRVSGRYAEIEFFTDGANRGWQLHGWDVDVVTAGER